MLGPVTSQMRASVTSSKPVGVSGCAAASTQSFSMKGPALAGASACSTTGWRPPRISKARCCRRWAGCSLLAASSARPASQSSSAKRCSDLARALLLRGDGRQPAPRTPPAPGQRASAPRQMRPSVSISSGVEKRTAPPWSGGAGSLRQRARSAAAWHCACVTSMKKPRILLWRTFSDSCRFARGISPRARPSPAAVLLQRARLVELGAEACAHEAAVAALMRRLVDERARRARSARSSATAPAGARTMRRAPPAGRCRRRHPRAAPARGGVPARRARRRDRAGRRAARRGGRRRARCRARTAGVSRSASRKLSSSCRKPTASRRATRCWRDRATGSTGAPPARARRGPSTVRSMAASRLPCFSPDSARSQLQAGAARGIDEQANGGTRAPRRPQARACVRSGSARHT